MSNFSNKPQGGAIVDSYTYIHSTYMKYSHWNTIDTIVCNKFGNSPSYGLALLMARYIHCTGSIQIESYGVIFCKTSFCCYVLWHRLEVWMHRMHFNRAVWMRFQRWKIGQKITDQWKYVHICCSNDADIFKYRNVFALALDRN